MAKKDKTAIENEIEKIRPIMDFIRINLTGESDIQEIADGALCSVSTVYNYVAGRISNIHLAKSIINTAKIIMDRNVIDYSELELEF